MAQYDKNNNLIKVFDSIISAGKETGANKLEIPKVCCGEAKTAKGLYGNLFKMIKLKII